MPVRLAVPGPAVTVMATVTHGSESDRDLAHCGTSSESCQ